MQAQLLDELVYVLLAIPQVVLLVADSPEVVEVLRYQMGSCIVKVRRQRRQVEHEVLTLLNSIHQLARGLARGFFFCR